MRLIDADAINFEDICDCCPSVDCGDCPGPEGFASWLKKQPTAYDPDKIVEQLRKEEAKWLDAHNLSMTMVYESVISIVKKGGA